MSSAFETGTIDVLRFLLDRCNPSPEECGRVMHKCLCIPADDKVAKIRLLIERGMNVDAPLVPIARKRGDPFQGERMTLLQWCCLNRRFQSALELLEAGADPNVASEDPRTPLHLTVENAGDSSASPRPRDGSFCIHVRRTACFVPLLRALLHFGADDRTRVPYRLDRRALGFEPQSPRKITAFELAVCLGVVEARAILSEHSRASDPPASDDEAVRLGEPEEEEDPANERA